MTAPQVGWCSPMTAIRRPRCSTCSRSTRRGATRHNARSSSANADRERDRFETGSSAGEDLTGGRDDADVELAELGEDRGRAIEPHRVHDVLEIVDAIAEERHPPLELV